MYRLIVLVYRARCGREPRQRAKPSIRGARVRVVTVMHARAVRVVAMARRRRGRRRGRDGTADLTGGRAHGSRCYWNIGGII